MIKMNFKSPLFWLGIAAGLPFLFGSVSCTATTAMGSGPEYLPGLAPQNITPAAPNPTVDTVSYWDGDGVPGSPKIEIDLSEQKAYYYKGGQLVGVSRISSGDSKHRTPTGTYRVTEKDVDHRSSAYGDFVDSAGNPVVRDVDVRKDKRPPGTRFLGAAMSNFLRFNRGIGMHAGFLPGYPASHGCVRLPDWISEKFYQHSKLGTPVIVKP